MQNTRKPELVLQNTYGKPLQYVGARNNDATEPNVTSLDVMLLTRPVPQTHVVDSAAAMSDANYDSAQQDEVGHNWAPSKTSLSHSTEAFHCVVI